MRRRRREGERQGGKVEVTRSACVPEGAYERSRFVHARSHGTTATRCRSWMRVYCGSSACAGGEAGANTSHSPVERHKEVIRTSRFVVYPPAHTELTRHLHPLQPPPWDRFHIYSLLIHTSTHTPCRNTSRTSPFAVFATTPSCLFKRSFVDWMLYLTGTNLRVASPARSAHQRARVSSRCV